MLIPFAMGHPTGAVLMVNQFDARIATTRPFPEAIAQHHLRYRIIGNKMDRVDAAEIAWKENRVRSRRRSTSLAFPTIR